MSEPDRITVAGHDLVEDLIGQVSFGEMTYLMMTGGTLPPPGHGPMLDALLVTFADHGVTPSSLAARLTLLGAPEALQAAVGAGISGAGSRYLGTLEEAAAMLQEALAGDDGSADLGALAAGIAAERRAAKRQVAGLGHPEHKGGDPRVPKLTAIAEQHGIAGRHMALFAELPGALADAGGPRLPLNAAGLAGAIVSDMGFEPSFGRGLAVVARAAGLVGQLLDEQRNPQAQKIWDGLR